MGKKTLIEVTILVVDESGAALQGTFISVLRSTVAFPEISLITDNNGIVTVQFPIGKYVIGAITVDGKKCETMLDLENSEFEQQVSVTMSVQ